MNVFVTVVSGVTVFVIGQIVLKLVIDPVQKLKEAIAEVAFSLWHDHATIHNAETVSEDRAKETSNRLRVLGARLAAGHQLIPYYARIHRLFGLPAAPEVAAAADELFKISNYMWGNDPTKYYRLDLCRMDVCTRLGIEDPIKHGPSRQELVDAINETRRGT